MALLASGELRGHKTKGLRRPTWVIYRDDLEAFIEALPAWQPNGGGGA